MKSSLLCFTALLVLGTTLVLQSFQSPQAAGSEHLSATYSHSVLHVTIPYVSPSAGAGRLTLEVLDPEDKPLAKIEPNVSIATGGAWKQDLKLTKPIAVEDLAWHRLHYRFEYDDGKQTAIDGTESISQILKTPILRIVGQQSYFTGASASVRVIATDSDNHAIGGASLRIELSEPNGTPRVLLHRPVQRPRHR